MVAELAREVDSITAEEGNGPTRALILASEVDAAFCAGADLKERKTFTKEQYSPYLHTKERNPELSSGSIGLSTF